MNERLKILRKNLNLSQTEFGKKLGLGLGVIKNLESEKTLLKEEQINLICLIYSVNYDWLKYGTGEMFTSETTNILNTLSLKYNLSNSEITFFNNYLSMDIEERKMLFNCISKLFQNNKHYDDEHFSSPDNTLTKQKTIIKLASNKGDV